MLIQIQNERHPSKDCRETSASQPGAGHAQKAPQETLVRSDMVLSPPSSFIFKAVLKL